MIIAPSLGIIFIHIHKAGGTSVEALLEPFLCWNDLQLGSSILGTAMNRPYKTRFGLNKHSSLKEIMIICGDEYVKSFYCFAVVREPVARICSLYNFTARTVRGLADSSQLSIEELKTVTSLEYPQLSWKPVRAFFDSDGFSGFLRHQALWEARAMNSQVASLRTEGWMAKHFKLEEPEIIEGMLSERLDAELKLPRLNLSKDILVSPATISTSDKDLIVERFAEDYEMLGYVPA